MPVDASMYSAFAPRVQSVPEIQNALAAQQHNALAAQEGQLRLRGLQTDMAEQDKVRNALVGLSPTATAQQRIEALQGTGTLKGFSAADALNKAQLDAEHVRSQIDAAKNKGAKDKIDTDSATVALVAQKLMPVSNPAEASAWYDEAAAKGYISPERAAAGKQNIPQTPQEFAAWKQNQLLGGMRAHEALTLKETQDNNLRVDSRSRDNAKLQSDTTLAANAATNRTHLQTAGIAQAGENARAAASRDIERVKADPFGTLGLNKNVPPGVAAQAGLSGDEYLKTLPPGVASQVKMMAEGKMPISAMTQRSPQGAALLQMAAQYEPGTDATVYQSRMATAKDAASGKLATSNNALNTVVGHLAGLADSADALNNTSFPWANKVKNFVQSNTGDPRVKAFNLNLNGVADELERAYRGAGGSEGSIKLWRENLGDTNSPDQFRQVMAKGAEMLQSKLEANQAQYEQGMHGKPGDYRTITPEAQAGLARLQGKGGPKSASGVPAEIDAILKKHGGK